MILIEWFGFLVLNSSENDIQTNSLWDGSYCYEYAILNDSTRASERVQVEAHFQTVSTPSSLKNDARGTVSTDPPRH